MKQQIQQKLRDSTGLRTSLIVLACLGASALAGPVWAKETPEPVNNEALRNLARDFVAKIGNKLKTHDENLKSEKFAGDSLSLIPDGEILLLRPRVEKFTMDRDIAAVKYDSIMYYNLQDILTQLELAVDYSDEKKTGSGWFLREDWLIRLDLISGEVVSRGKTYKVLPQDIRDEDGQIYISQNAAKTWLEIETNPDIAQQYLNIRTPYPFPALARNYRERDTSSKGARSQAVLPRYDQEEEMFKLNVVETQHSLRAVKRQDEPTTFSQQNSTIAEGEVLKHTLYANTFWDNEENLSSVRARLTKEDENPVLLGPLKARAYTLGDTDLPSLPLTGNSSQELGVRINNNPLRNADFQDTTINGDALPGWDVELYRDGIVVDRLRVGEDARYEFQDIQLFAGDNLFEVFFYGPQGEIRRDNFNIPVNEEFLSTQDNTYDVSVSFNDTQLYSKYPSEDEDANSPHVVARYNKVIGKTLTYAGVRAREIDGEQKAYLGTGFTNVMGGFVLDGNAAADEKGATAIELGTRKNIDNWRLALRGLMRDEEFLAENESSNIQEVTGTASRNFVTPFDTLASVNATALYGIREDDSTQTKGFLGISNQMGRFNLSNTLIYDKIDNMPGSGDSQVRIDDSVAARLSMGRFFARGGVDFNIEPESQINKYFTQLSYQPNKTIGTDLLLEHNPNSKLSEARLTVNYRHDKFRLSPFVDVDTNSEVQAGVKLTTSLINEPQKPLPTFTGQRVIGRGMVSSFVYHDKNGNGVFDANDVPLPDVYVQSVNVSRREKTDEQGYSLIKDLPESYVTDIRLDSSTLPDPFMIPGFDGVSIFPKAGQVVKLTFPVHLAGEVDGVVSVEDQELQKQVAGMAMNLIPVDGKSTAIIDTYTASDGFYVLNSVPPGNYLLAVNSGAAAKLNAGGAKPVPITIGYDGTILSNKDFALTKGRVQVPVSIKPYKGSEHTMPFFAMETGTNTAKSKLSNLLSRLVEKKANIRADEGLSPITLENEENLKILPGQDWSAHYDRCQLLNDQKIPCNLILFVPEKKKGTKPTVVAQN